MKHKLFLLILLFTFSLWGQTATAPLQGDGSEGDPYEIATLENLYWITQDTARFTKYYTQTANIDASPTASWDFGPYSPEPGSESGFRGFLPIGSVYGFSGNYDGGGYRISDLFIHRNNFVGLFYSFNNAVVRNLELKNVSMTGIQYVGGISGSIQGSSISDVTVGGDLTGNHAVGAVAGYCDNSSLTDCEAEANVSGVSTIGGVAGIIFTGSSMIRCHFSGTVKDAFTGGGITGQCRESTLAGCSSNAVVVCTNAGGAAGKIENSSTVSRCSSAGTVTGNMAGGFAGNISSSTVDNCYSRADVVTDAGFSLAYQSAMGFAGCSLSQLSNCYCAAPLSDSYYYRYGFISGSDNTVSHSFWDSGISGAAASDAGTSATTAEMTDQAYYTGAGWDFGSIWEMNAGENNDYPMLQVYSNDPPLPVTMMDFCVKEQNGSAVIGWTTETEVENAYFIITRDGEELVRLPGAGSSCETHCYAYTDHLAGRNSAHNYELFSLDYANRREFCASTLFRSENTCDMPDLKAVYPNPFNPRLEVVYSLPCEENVRVTVHDISGKELDVLSQGIVSAGDHRVVWEAGNRPSGIYIVRVCTEDNIVVSKVCLKK